MDALNEETLREAAEKLGAAAGCRVRAMDVFYFFQDPSQSAEYRAASFSFGDPTYLQPDGLLDQFLREYGTAGFALDAEQRGEPLSGKTSHPGKRARHPARQIYRRSGDLTWPKSGFKRATLEELISFLTDHRFGRFCFLTTVHHPVGTINVHFSTFVVLDETISGDKKLKVAWEILWLMLSKFGALITEELYTQAVRYREERAAAREQTLQVKHLVQNNGIQQSVALLKMALDDQHWEEAQTRLRELAHQQVICDFAIDILFNADQGPHHLLLNRKKIAKYTSLLRLLHEAFRDPSRLMVLGLDDVEDHAANFIPLVELVPTFMLLLNLWDNARRCQELHPGADPFTITARRSESSINLVFANNGELSGHEADALQGNPVASPGDGRGFNDIQHSLSRLPRVTLLPPKAAHGRTEIALQIARP